MGRFSSISAPHIATFAWLMPSSGITSSVWDLLPLASFLLSASVLRLVSFFNIFQSLDWSVSWNSLCTKSKRKGPPQTFPWCVHCCVSGSSVDVMLCFRMCCLAGEHPGKKRQWKIAIAGMAAIDGASNLSLGKYEICCSSQLFGGSLLSYISSDVCMCQTLLVLLMVLL